MVLLKWFFMILNGVGMLKKYFYVSILLGSIALSGCTDDEDNSKVVTEESLNTEKSIEINNKVNTTKTEEVGPIPLDLTQEQKEEYYQKYVDIINNLNAEYQEDYVLEPITAFLDDYWIEVNEFEKMAKERANMSITVLENNERYNPGLVPKKVKLKIGTKEINLVFKGSFDTQLNENTPKGRQLFSAFHSISSEDENVEAGWTQMGYTDYTDLKNHNGIIYPIILTGEFSHSGIISQHNIELEFHCDENGGIS